MSGNYFEDTQVMNRMQVMCEESLCPEHFEMWETIKAALQGTRVTLNDPNAEDYPLAGMYGGTLRVRIGDKNNGLVICRQSKTSVWFEEATQGTVLDGGEFSDDLVYPVLREFFNNHF